MNEDLLKTIALGAVGGLAYPPSQRAHRLFAHLVYGLTAAAAPQSGLAPQQQRRQLTSWTAWPGTLARRTSSGSA